jgi:uncharacterized protein (TIRG00374 family)
MTQNATEKTEKSENSVKMNQKSADAPSFLARNWKLILNIFTAVALIGLAIALRHQVGEVIKNLGKVHVWALLLLIPLEFINYDAQARMYRKLFGILGNKLSYKDMFKLSLELNFVNSVFPSGGVSGISYFGVRMRSHDVTAARATLVQLMKLVLLFLSFEVLVLFGVLAMAIGGKATGLVVLLAGSLTTVMVLGTLAFVYIIGSKRRINAFFTFATQVINKMIHFIRPNHPETINIARARQAFDDMHANYELFREHYKDLRSPFVYALIANMAEVLAVYAIYIAFGQWVNLGAIILAYAIANFAGFISVLPGGLGVYEALMTGVLVIAGVPAAVSIPVVVMYRVLNTAIQLPPGYYFYHKALKSKVGTAEV